LLNHFRKLGILLQQLVDKIHRHACRVSTRQR
jgi:hypothetical protein